MKNTHKDGRSMPVNRANIIPISSIQPDPNDPNFFCRACKRHYINKYGYFMHIRLIRPDTKLDNIKREAIITPIMAEIDAGNHDNKPCTICDYEFSTRGSYKMHMNTIHRDGNRKPAALRRFNTAMTDTSIIPIWNDPNHYCQSCRRMYANKKSYQVHIKNFHSKALQESMQLSTSSPTTSM